MFYSNSFIKNANRTLVYVKGNELALLNSLAYSGDYAAFSSLQFYRSFMITHNYSSPVIVLSN